MTDYSTARRSMVDSQIHTMGVVSDPILDAFRTIGRENFVPESMRGYAYVDEDIMIAPGRWLMEPVTHARLMQAAGPVKTDTVLDIGCGTGYSSAILSSLAARIVAVEPAQELLAAAQSNWAKGGHDNITGHCAPCAEGAEQHAPYTLIFVNGAVHTCPPTLLNQLAPGGRLVAVIRTQEEKIGRATTFTKNDSGIIGERVLFDAAVHYLPGCAPQPGFVF